MNPGDKVTWLGQPATVVRVGDLLTLIEVALTKPFEATIRFWVRPSALKKDRQ